MQFLSPPPLGSDQQILAEVGVRVGEGCQESAFYFILFQFYFILIKFFSVFKLYERFFKFYIVFYNFQKFHTHDFI